MKRRGAAVLGLILLAAGLAAFALAGQTRAHGSASVLVVLAGRVELAHGPAPYAIAIDGETVVSGDRVRTDPSGHAVVTFFDGSTLDIAPQTEVTIVAATATDGAVDLRIAQAIGRTFSSVHKLVDPRSRYEIYTPSITAVVRGTKFEIWVAADGFATERTTEGLVAVSSAGTEVLVPAGSETAAGPGIAPTPPSTIPPAPGTSPAPTAAPAVITAAPPRTPTTAPVGPSGPNPTTSAEASAPASPSPSPAPASETLVPPSLLPPPTTTLVPLPTASIAPLPTVTTAPLPSVSTAPLPTTTLVPLPTASIAPLPTVTTAPLPSVSTAPLTSPTPSPIIGLPIATLP